MLSAVTRHSACTKMQLFPGVVRIRLSTVIMISQAPGQWHAFGFERLLPPTNNEQFQSKKERFQQDSTLIRDKRMMTAPGLLVRLNDLNREFQGRFCRHDEDEDEGKGSGGGRYDG